MYSFKDATDSVPEKKSVRVEQRMKPSIRKAIERAAAAVGVDETAFITSAAYEKAKEVERAHLATQLPSEHFDAFVEALEAPAMRIEGLADAAGKSRRILRDG